jgi:hypothetical protein
MEKTPSVFTGSIHELSSLFKNCLDILRNYNIERIELLNNLKLFLIYNIRYLEKFYHEKT